LASSPNFDPHAKKLEENWQSMMNPGCSFSLPCHPGLYAPGSTFKILVTAAAVEKGLESKVFDDNGSVVIDGREIRNSESRAYGKIDLKRALAVSSNVVYAQLGTELGMESFVDITYRAGLRRKFLLTFRRAKAVSL